MALPKQHRLKHRRDFDAVYQRGLRRGSTCFTLRALRLRLPSDKELASEPAPTRIGISISKKVSKRAVVRNRIKRQIRAAVRQLLPRLSPGWNIVIGVRSTPTNSKGSSKADSEEAPAIQCDYFQFLQELEQLLTKAEVLYGD